MYFLSYFFTHKIDRSKLALIIIAMVLACSSCVSTQRLARQQMAATFQSYSNGVADIELEMKPNGRFTLAMNILPDPSGDVTTSDNILMRGKWKIKDSGYELRFKKRNRPDLVALVGSNYFPDTNLSVIDEETLLLPSNQSEIVIWGVKCFKK